MSELSDWIAQFEINFSVALIMAAFTMAIILMASLFFRNAKRHMKQEYELRQIELERSKDIEISNLKTLREESNSLITQLRQQLAAVQGENIELKISKNSLEIELQQREKSLTQQQEQLKLAQESLKREFELLANRLFQDKQELFVKNARTNIEQLIMPFQLQLKDFYHRLEVSHKSEQDQRSQLLGQLGELQKQSQQLSHDAISLTQALKGSNKVTGSWGELVLSRLLESAGLTKGREYDLQVSSTTENGRRIQPDAIIHLPEGKEIVVDSKVSLVSYESWVNAQCDVERRQAERQFAESVKSHIRGLSTKQYGVEFGIQSLEFVFLFIPIEQAFNLLVHNHQDIVADAFSKQVVIAGPANLMVALKTIEALWQRDRQDKNIEKIVDSAGKLHDQFVLFAESFCDIGQSLDRAQSSYNKALDRLCDRRGNIVKRVDDLKSLGAKALKSIPDPLMERADVRETENELS